MKEISFYRSLKQFLLILLIVFFPNAIFSQWEISVQDSFYHISFDSTLLHVNEGAFDGSGINTSPSSGQLNSNTWRFIGFSDGDSDFGETHNSGDFSRGTSSGAVSTGGMYAFQTGFGNTALGIQQGGSDFTPGEIILKLMNSTAQEVVGVELNYNLFVYNDQNRSSSVNFYYSTDGNNYTLVSGAEYISTESSDAIATWDSLYFTIPISGLSIQDANNLFLKWELDDAGGSGSRDEIAIDNIQVKFVVNEEVICVSEAFDNCFNSDFDIAAGWRQSGFDDNDFYNSASNSGLAIPSIKFNESNDTLLSPELDEIAEISFWYKGVGVDVSSQLDVEVFDGENWHTLESINNIGNTESTKVYNQSSSPALSTGMNRVRFIYTKSAGNLAFDDVSISCLSSCVSGTKPSTSSTLLVEDHYETGVSVSLNRAEGENYIMLLGETQFTDALIDETNYWAETYTYGSMPNTGQYVVKRDTQTQFTISGLEAGTEYFYQISDYNCGLNKQLYSSSPTYGSLLTKPLEVEEFESICVASQSVVLSWNPAETGNVTGYLLVGRESSNSPSSKADDKPPHLYAASLDFSVAEVYDVPTNSKVLYHGSSTEVEVTNLNALSDYSFAVYAYLANADDTVYANDDALFLTTEVQGISNLQALATNNGAKVSWQNPESTACIQQIQVILDDDSDTQTPDETANANSHFGLGDMVTGGGYVVYNGLEENLDISGLTAGTTYTASVFVYDGHSWSSAIQYSFVAIANNEFDYGDVAIVSLNTNGSFGDEICFVNLREFKQYSSIDITDNGYERLSSGLWGDTEGVLRLTRTGTEIGVGQTFCITGSGNSDDDFIEYTCGSNDDAGWQISSLNGNNDFQISDNDQVFVLQGGNWKNGNSQHQSSYDGRVLFGASTNGWQSAMGYNNSNESTQPYGLNCFMIDFADKSISDTKIKYYGDLLQNFTQFDWVLELSDSANWTSYANNTAFNTNGHNYRSNGDCSAITFKVDHVYPSSFTWNGSEDNDWFNCENWDYLSLPDSTRLVELSGVFTPEISKSATNYADVFISALSIEDDAELLIEQGASIMIKDSLNVSGTSNSLDLETGAWLILNGDSVLVKSLADSIILEGNLKISSGSQSYIHTSIEGLDSLEISTGSELNLDSTYLIVDSLIEVEGTLVLEDDASLIFGENTVVSGGGSIEINRLQADDNQGTTVTNYWSAPVNDASIVGESANLNGTHNWRYPGGEDDNDDFSRLTTETSMLVARGYATYGETSASFSSPITALNTGKIQLDLAAYNEEDADADDTEFYLVGNPFPFAINAADFITHNAATNTEIEGVIYVFSQVNSLGSYDREADNIAISLVGPSDPGIDAEAADFDIASCQGFFISKDEDNALTDLLEFTPSMASKNNANFKSGSYKGASFKNRLWLMINDETNYQTCLLAFAEDASLGKDRLYDASIVPTSNSLRIFTSIKNYDYLIQALPPVNQVTARIPIGFSVPKAGDYHISVPKMNNWPSNQALYLFDAHRQRYYNLLEEDFVYQSTDKEVVKDRFYLQFKGKGVAVSVNESIDKNVNYLGLTETNIELLLKPNHEVEQIIVLNELGQKIDEVSPSKSQYVSLKKSSTLNLLQFKMKDGSVEVLKLK